MSVRTMGGDWSTSKYDIIKNGANEVGVDMDLRFMPDAPVDAKKIGLTQTANSKNEGTVVALSETVKNRSIEAGKTDEGAHIDHLASARNPLYAARAPATGDAKLSDTATNPDWGQHGFHFKDGAAIKKDFAQLKDNPHLDARGANASQIFETTALCIEGAQVNTYYGSVQWGWTTDAAGKFTQLPLTLKSEGVPSTTFMKSAELWNKNPTSSGADTIDLPLTSHHSHDVCYTMDGLDKKIAELEAKAKLDADPNIAFEILALKQERDKRIAAGEGKK